MNDTPQYIMEHAPDSDTLGGRISRARDALGFTVQQLARRMSTSGKTITAWESDRSEPRANRLVMLAGILGVTPAWLLHGVGSAPEDDVRLDAIRVATSNLRKMKAAHLEMGGMIERLENELVRLSRSA